MYDKTILLDILQQTLEASQRVIERFKPVSSVGYFIDSELGMEKLDSICMLLIAIGESLKKIDKITSKSLLSGYPEVDWKGAKGMRDIISHHYFDIDAEEIYWVCENKIMDLSRTLEKVIADIMSAEISS